MDSKWGTFDSNTGELVPNWDLIPSTYWKELDRQSKQSIDTWLVKAFETNVKNIQFFISVTCFISFVTMAILSL